MVRLIALLLPSILLGGSLADRIESAIGSSDAARQAFWGIRIVDLKTGSVVYSRNEDNFFVPASNAKLFATSLALLRLGADHRFVTRLAADAEPDASGTVKGLRLIGGGDPNLSGRVLPYQHKATGTNSLTVIDEFADSLLARGVRRVDGPIAGDDSAFDWQPFGEGWSVDDPTWGYGAPVSAIALNDNMFSLFVAPGQALGDPAAISLSPKLEHLTIHNKARTGEETELSYSRYPGSSELIVTGTIASGSVPVRQTLAVDDPALFAAEALREALARRGIEVPGHVTSIHCLTGQELPVTPAVNLVQRKSLPLLESLRVINKVSQNLHAEMLLREVARVRTGRGSAKAGLKELQDFLGEIGIDENQYRFEDGSGLSRLTLVTPRTVSKLLMYMYETEYRDAWISTLPIGGEDGSLASRFNRMTGASNVRAKTGSLSHISTLSGYAKNRQGRELAFSVLVNNFNSGSAVIQKVIDRIALELTK